MKSLFPYSGNKSRYLSKYRSFPQLTRLVCEPFAGYASISIASGLPYLLAEADPGIRDLFNTGRSVDLTEWRRQVEETRHFTLVHGSVRNVQICDALASLRPWQSFIVRVQACGMYVGTACSTMLQSQFIPALLKRLDLLATKDTHEALQRCVGCESDYTSLLALDDPSCAFVVDTPYLGTAGNYKGNDVTPEKLRHFVLCKKESPVMVTYGAGAPEIWPDLDWQLVAQRKVSRIRSGGTLVRPEHVAYVRWDEKETE